MYTIQVDLYGPRKLLTNTLVTNQVKDQQVSSQQTHVQPSGLIRFSLSIFFCWWGFSGQMQVEYGLGHILPLLSPKQHSSFD